MPLIQSHDSKGSYFKWGSSGKHYHFKPHNSRSKLRARLKAILQGKAITISKLRKIGRY